MSKNNRKSTDIKICINSNCRKPKFPNNVHYRNKKKGIIHQECRECANKRAKKFRERNKDKIKVKQKEYYEEKGRELKKIYDKKNLKKSNERDKKRYKEDPNYRMKRILRSRLYKVTKKGQKSGHMENYLGTDMNSFLKWIEFQFDNNMSWKNQGSYWHIDHVLPCNSFDLTKEKQIERCFRWTNLRPLKGTENDSKGAKVLISEYDKHRKVVTEYMFSTITM